ncbi:MAG: lytic transglycosylase domain-containing protein [Alphaproteobacteria bacterium]|nr:lytic transglycosylase domain-containing protein [Alphaproteobacteria bacterium]
MPGGPRSGRRNGLRGGTASFGWCFALVAASLFVLVAAAAAEEAKPPASAEGPQGWPHILSEADAARYHALFELQEQAKWAEADASVGQLQDRLLMGHVLAQRYLHPKYKTGYAELAAWLALYSDHSEARTIYALAMSRRPKGTAAPSAPEAAPIAWRGARDDPADFRPAHAPSRSDAVAEAVERIKAEIRLEAKRDPEAAERLLDRAASRHALSDDDLDEARADIAEGFLFTRRYLQALHLGAEIRTDAYRPLAHWVAGLSYWGLGRLDEARGHFEALARSPNISPWNIAAAAYWAARVHLAAHRPELASYWLGEAAEEPRTFYGMLARSTLGLRPYRPPAPAAASQGDVARVCEIPAGKRALALLQIAERGRAETELRVLIANASPAVLAALVPVADRANLPAVSLELAARIGDGALREQALYPLPRWQPWGGYHIDRALLLAFMRQESQFRPDNKSPAGAIGLMQVMWDTARLMAPSTGLDLSSPEVLRDPEINLALGQAYLRHLLGQQQIAGNLVMLAAAYNLGPGWFDRWSVADAYPADPLFFLETMPSRETRVFVERVLTNYWIYQLRLGHPAHDLDLLAAGAWPVYVPGSGEAGAASGSDRHAAR